MPHVCGGGGCREPTGSTPQHWEHNLLSVSTLDLLVLFQREFSSLLNMCQSHEMLLDVAPLAALIYCATAVLRHADQ